MPPFDLPLIQWLLGDATRNIMCVKGSLGTLVRPSNKLVTVKNEAGKLSFVPVNESAEADAMSGTMRALVANMVNGVSKGFEKKLNLVGVGFRAQAQGQKLNRKRWHIIPKYHSLTNSSSAD